MRGIRSRCGFMNRLFQGVLAVACAVLMVPGDAALLAQQATPAAAPAPSRSCSLPDQLDSLVAPIALYPDALLAQTLAASTYPLEIVQLQQWLAKNPNLKDKALVGRGRQAALGSVRPVHGGVPGGRQAPRRRHPVDERSRQRVPRPAVRRHGRRAADAQEGRGQGDARDERAAEGRDEGHREEGGHRHRVREPRRHLRAVLRPGGRLRRADLPVPADLLPLLYPGAAFVSFGFGIAMGAFWGGDVGRLRLGQQQRSTSTSTTTSTGTRQPQRGSGSGKSRRSRAGKSR